MKNCFVIFFLAINIIISPIYYILLNNYSPAVFHQNIDQLGIVGIMLPNFALITSNPIQLITFNLPLFVLYLFALFVAVGSILTFGSLLIRLDGKYMVNDLKIPAAFYLIQIITCGPFVSSLNVEIINAIIPTFSFVVGCSICIGFIILGVHLRKAY